MAVYKSKAATRDGRCYFFKIEYYIGDDPTPKTMVSKKFSTKLEAIRAEQEFIKSTATMVAVPKKMTFQELYDKFIEDRSESVRYTTFSTYPHMYRYIKEFMKIKCVDYNMEHYAKWRVKMLANKNIGTRYKNDILKFWKSILNYGSTYVGFDFTSTYRKMEKFKDPDGVKKEMNYFTLDEFKQFVSYETDLRFKCLWETLYYCGLRIGEARGLTWEDIDFDKKIVWVNKQVQAAPSGELIPYKVCPPKTRTSNRRIPICDVLINDLIKYREYLNDRNQYVPTRFIFGTKEGVIPLTDNTAMVRKNRLCKTAGVKQIRLHDFRHSCASLLINNGGNVTLVAKYLGHSEIEETLNTYSHMFPSALDSVLDIVNDLNNKEFEKL